MGQVFLKVQWPVEQMAELLRAHGVERVVEIGPGGGVLTRALMEVGLAVTAVEKDDRFAAHIDGQRELWESLCPGKLQVVHADFLRYDLGAWLAGGKGVAALVGNIPYHVSSPIVLKALDFSSDLAMVLIMTQREFAERVAAKSSTKAFGSLTVFTQLRADAKVEFLVPRDCFQPVPKVDSAVVSLQPRAVAIPVETLAKTEQLTRHAFTQRRKKLRNSIEIFLHGHDEADSPVDLERRADALTPAEFVTLAEWLIK